MKRTSIYVISLVAAIAITTLGAADKQSKIPKAFWGKYCPEGQKSCTPREVYIDRKQVWSESMGGCAQIEKVEEIADGVQVTCSDASKVTLKSLPKKKISITIGEDEAVTIQKVK